jgi:galactose mutarotase-like enzyme
MIDWTADRATDGLLAVTLDNTWLRVSVFPELGGKIWSIFYKPRQREMLWHHPAIAPALIPPGASFDDTFSGGWDEIFPNDDPVTIDGLQLPDHGEWWSIPWEWHVDAIPGALVLTLEATGPVTSHQARRTLTLPDDRPTLALTTQITNTGAQPIPYLWRHHPAFPVTPGARLELPATEVIADRVFTPNLSPEPFTWPLARTANGDTLDPSALPPPDSGETWLLYATNLPEGRCAIVYPDEDIGISLDFDPSPIDTITIFATFGGWRGLNTILPEPGIGMPSNLQEAMAAGRYGTLLPDQAAEFAVMATIFEHQNEPPTASNRDRAG